MVPVGMVEVVEIAGVMIIEGEVEMGGGSGGFGGSISSGLTIVFPRYINSRILFISFC